MDIIEGNVLNWKIYMSNDSRSEKIKNSGKWMYFFKASDIEAVTTLCRKSVLEDVVCNVKHTGNEYLTDTGVACFYIDGLNTDQHNRVLRYFMDNNMIPRNKNGNYRNIAFKFDEETRQGSYGDNFKAKLNLSDFVDVTTGEFI